MPDSWKDRTAMDCRTAAHFLLGLLPTAYGVCVYEGERRQPQRWFEYHRSEADQLHGAKYLVSLPEAVTILKDAGIYG